MLFSSLWEDIKWNHYNDKGSLIKLVITKLVSLNCYFRRARQLMWIPEPVAFGIHLWVSPNGVGCCQWCNWSVPCPRVCSDQLVVSGWPKSWLPLWNLSKANTHSSFLLIQVLSMGKWSWLQPSGAGSWEGDSRRENEFSPVVLDRKCMEGSRYLK